MLKTLNQKSFTLVELIMTIVVTAIIAIPLSLTICQQMASAFQSRDYSEALNLARYEMERINNLPYTDIDSYIIPNYLGYPYTLRCTTTYIAGSDVTPESLKQIVVQVRRSGSLTDSARLITYLARNVVYPF